MVPFSSVGIFRVRANPSSFLLSEIFLETAFVSRYLPHMRSPFSFFFYLGTSLLWKNWRPPPHQAMLSLFYRMIDLANVGNSLSSDAGGISPSQTIILPFLLIRRCDAYLRLFCPAEGQIFFSHEIGRAFPFPSSYSFIAEFLFGGISSLGVFFFSPLVDMIWGWCSPSSVGPLGDPRPQAKIFSFCSYSKYGVPFAIEKFVVFLFFCTTWRFGFTCSLSTGTGPFFSLKGKRASRFSLWMSRRRSN